MNRDITRVVALGASNLSLGLESLRSTAVDAWGPEVEILAAPGYGRSYGAPSTILVRTLPGILGCGVWRVLRELPPAPTRALVTDLGNDILYEVPAPRILDWVEKTIDRLLAHTADVVLTDLPVDSVTRLSPARFLFFRTLFFPACRLSREEVFARVGQLNEGLIRLAAVRQVRLVRLKPRWYGLDPIHIRPRFWSASWRDILLGESAPEQPASPFSAPAWARSHLLPPERRWLLGIERVRPQSGRWLGGGGRLWLY